mmetsp:Transcript_36390/g.60809  ORF Transcript_36390/g.60809 Transcript_36390/m.60809 type:complete len:80 (+) Transcript_36390:251-490(+)|eukprot:CAMPEP_0174297030 /NCGR_PEP_ID=MMETSP0809-20121228/49871_1 /TAXON_ID=73025 ORGANISM="Eutreptiella gymnastica-like, Strain CCMP1594" /NCGR_SAMPLE_ID=MMETSP0809 /ASSEMBLY_ACC=CAM_ASM_000658 /LENGTH=79 /DNA_ID=CAMNT_0015400537 /DNA_START=99 /DNA_END=338 /DNA_ORIENTATION=-
MHEWESLLPANEQRWEVRVMSVLRSKFRKWAQSLHLASLSVWLDTTPMEPSMQHVLNHQCGAHARAASLTGAQKHVLLE